ncbi:MAG: hypothetical protein R3Y43_05570 [Alphaproteobacteria bacterium]
MKTTFAPLFDVEPSRHHYDDEINENLFGSSKAISLQELAELNKTFNGRLSIQLVMCKDYIGTLTELQKFLDAFIEREFMNFNLRGVAKLSTTVGNRDKKIDFCNDNQVDLIKVIDDITKNSDFSFHRQSIGNNSLHEFFSYRGANLKFIYGNNDCFRLYDEEHVKNGGNTIASILILLPTGAFFRNWNYDISRI